MIVMSNPIIPNVMRAVVTQPNKILKVEEVPVPEIDDWEILVKIIAVAQNPTDHQYLDAFGNVGTIVGVDWSGLVVKLGNKVAELEPIPYKIGDHVAGFTHGSVYTDRGAYAEYVKATYDLCWKVPDGTLTHEQAATMGCGYWTAVQCFFRTDRLGMVEPPNRDENGEYVFIYSGSSSVGMYAIQLAHLAGYKVVTVASPRNHALCRSLGADYVFDYKDPASISRIKEVTKDSIHRALDTISEEATRTFTLSVFGSGPGRLLVIRPLSERAKNVRPDVNESLTVIYTTLGRSFNLGREWPVSEEDHAHMAQFLKKTPELIVSGKIKPNPVKLWEGGLDAIPDGLQYMKEGKVSAEKIVYRIA